MSLDIIPTTFEIPAGYVLLPVGAERQIGDRWLNRICNPEIGEWGWSPYVPSGTDWARHVEDGKPCIRPVSPSPQATPTEGRGPSPEFPDADFWEAAEKWKRDGTADSAMALLEAARTLAAPSPSLDKLREAVGYIKKWQHSRCGFKAGTTGEINHSDHCREADRILALFPAPAGVDAGLREALGLARRLEEVANALNGETFIPISPTTLHAAARHIRSLAARPHPEEQGGAGWKTISAEHPPRGGVYAVQREGVKPFVAEVCYGMHAPWWVPTIGSADGAFPVDDGDKWIPWKDLMAGRPEEQGEAPDLECLTDEDELLGMIALSEEADRDYQSAPAGSVYERKALLARTEAREAILKAFRCLRSRTPSQGFPEFWAKEAAGRRLPAYFTEGELKGMALDAYCAGLKQGRSQGGANG